MNIKTPQICRTHIEAVLAAAARQDSMAESRLGIDGPPSSSASQLAVDARIVREVAEQTGATLALVARCLYHDRVIRRGAPFNACSLSRLLCATGAIDKFQPDATLGGQGSISLDEHCSEPALLAQAAIDLDLGRARFQPIDKQACLVTVSDAEKFTESAGAFSGGEQEGSLRQCLRHETA